MRVFRRFAKRRGLRKSNEIGREKDVRRKAQRVRTSRKEEGGETVVGEGERFRRLRRFEIGRLANFRAVGASGVERRVNRFASEFAAVANRYGGTFGGRFGDKERERGRVGGERLGVFGIFVIFGVDGRERLRGKRGLGFFKGESARKFFRTPSLEERVEFLKTTATSVGKFRVGLRSGGLRRRQKAGRSRRLKVLRRLRERRRTGNLSRRSGVALGEREFRRRNGTIRRSKKERFPNSGRLRFRRVGRANVRGRRAGGESPRR